MTTTYTHDYATGQFTRTGPDGVGTYVETDVAGRVSYMRRGSELSPLLEATYTYNAGNALVDVTYGNGASVEYDYDDAGRLTEIGHKAALGLSILRMVYAYNDNNLVESITEYNASGPSPIAGVDFSYDDRGRLIGEVRTGANPYAYSYEYDQGGNRTKKWTGADEWVKYYYDIYMSEYDGSANNRLMYFEEYEDVASPTLQSTTWHYYNASGNIKQITTQESGSDVYTSTRLVYARNGQAVSYIIGEICDETDSKDPVYTFSFAREFRYDGARQRYLSAELSYSGNGGWLTVSETWSDYDGNSIYGDFSVTGGTATNLTSFEPGIGRVVDPLGTPSSSYYHSDMLGTTRLMTNSSGIGSAHAVYTAFGEPVSGNGGRYGYVGAWGYQSHDDVPFLHVGARYYAPSTGRFLQRDPIGILGGLNVYEYVRSIPTVSVDPSGLFNDTAIPGYGVPLPWRGGGITRAARPPGGYTGPDAAEFVAHLYLACTGGKRSWLDNKELVDEIVWWSDLVGWVTLPPVAKAPVAIKWAIWVGKGAKHILF